MRLDKFLKVARIYKRRTIAKEVSKSNRITINNHLAKPSSDVKVGDILIITYGTTVLTIKVKQISTHATKEMSESMYEIIDELKLN